MEVLALAGESGQVPGGKEVVGSGGRESGAGRRGEKERRMRNKPRETGRGEDIAFILIGCHILYEVHLS